MSRLRYSTPLSSAVERRDDRSFTVAFSRHGFVAGTGEEIYLTWDPADCSLIPLAPEDPPAPETLTQNSAHGSE